MTIARIKKLLTPIAEAGAIQTAALSVAALCYLRGRGFVRFDGDDRWTITPRGRGFLAMRRPPRTERHAMRTSA